MGGGLGGVTLNQNSERLSSSLARFQPKIADNVKTRNVTLDWIMPRKELYDGGLEIGVRFRYRKKAKLGEAGNHVGAYRYYSQLNTSPSDTIKNGRETWSNLQVPITLSNQEKRENAGKKEFDRLKESTEESMDILAEQVNDILWGVAGGDQSLLPTPITDIVSGTDSLTLHGLAKSSNAWLNSQSTSSIGDASDFLLEKMTEGYNLCVDNAPNKSDALDIFLMARQPFQVLQNIMPAYVTYQNNKNVDIGFPTLIHMGIPVRFDSTIPLDSNQQYQVYGLMGKYWEFAIDRELNFATTKFYDMLPDQHSVCAQLFLTFAVVCNQPRTNWRGTGVTV
jgi:hypothetical protein